MQYLCTWNHLSVSCKSKRNTHMYIVHGSLEQNVFETSRFNEMSKALVRSEQNVLHLDTVCTWKSSINLRRVMLRLASPSIAINIWYHGTWDTKLVVCEIEREKKQPQQQKTRCLTIPKSSWFIEFLMFFDAVFNVLSFSLEKTAPTHQQIVYLFVFRLPRFIEKNR